MKFTKSRRGEIEVVYCEGEFDVDSEEDVNDGKKNQVKCQMEAI
jgi:hypothetical protein